MHTARRTVLNDTAEGKAIMELFGEVPVSSTKSMMGHSLGAAGAIEAVVSLLALQHQFLPPNINFRQAELSLNIVANQPRDAQFDCADFQFLRFRRDQRNDCSSQARAMSLSIAGMELDHTARKRRG